LGSGIKVLIAHGHSLESPPRKSLANPSTLVNLSAWDFITSSLFASQLDRDKESKLGSYRSKSSHDIFISCRILFGSVTMLALCFSFHLSKAPVMLINLYALPL